MNGTHNWSTDLPVFDGTAAAAAMRLGEEGGSADAVTALTGGSGLGRHLDDALAGGAAPRVWLLVHEPGQTHLAAVAALAFAEGLAARDQAAFVLDGDDRTTALSRWLGRGDSEGWIDLVRYGASVLTAGEGLPFDGRTAYLLGVGSYAPTDATADEVAQLLSRLRRQADDILVVTPVDTAGLWTGLADIRLLCLDRGLRGADEVAELVSRLSQDGVAPTGLVAYPASDAADATTAPVTDHAAGPHPEEDALPEAPAAPGPVDDVTAHGPDGEEPAGETGAGAVEESADAVAEAPPEASVAGHAAGRKRGSTSGVFWFAAAAAVVIIGAIGAYYLRFMREPADSPAPPAVSGGWPAQENDGAQVTEETTDPAGSAAAMADSAAGDAAAVEVADGPQATRPVTDEPAADEPETGTHVATEPVTQEPAPAVDAAPARPVFDAAAFTGEVGAEGWALHLYSFPDSAAAAEQVGVLARKGIDAAVRSMVIKDRGLYHRIYVGSFPDRAAAREAMPGLLEKLRTDWANPVRFGAGG